MVWSRAAQCEMRIAGSSSELKGKPHACRKGLCGTRPQPISAKQHTPPFILIVEPHIPRSPERRCQPAPQLKPRQPPTPIRPAGIGRRLDAAEVELDRRFCRSRLEFDDTTARQKPPIRTTDPRLQILDADGLTSGLEAQRGAAAKAVEAADAPAILSAWTLLVERLPGVPDGADDEAEDVARELMTMIVALRDRGQIEALANSISRSGPAVRRRFEPIDAELRELVDVAERYVQFVASNPGFTQSGLGGALGVDQQVARRIGWYLAELGVVDRVREKHSYRLYITED